MRREDVEQDEAFGRSVSSKSPAKLDALTVTRFVAAMLVVLFHYGRQFPPYTWWPDLFGKANCAVAYFFCLSGFVLAYVYGQQHSFGIRMFWTSRLARVLPLYLLALVVVVAAKCSSGSVEADQLLLSSILIQSWIPGYSQVLNAPGWSLANEWFFYLLFPLLLPFLARTRSAAVLLSIAIAAWLLSVGVELFVESSGEPGSIALHDCRTYHPLMHLGTFVVGMCAGLAFISWRPKISRWGSSLVLIAMLICIALLMSNEFVRDHHHNSLLAPLFAIAILGVAASSDCRIGRCLSLPPFVHLGEISYGIYILQFPMLLVFAWVKARADWELGGQVEFYLYLALLLIAAHVSYVYFENPIRYWLKSFSNCATTRTSNSRYVANSGTPRVEQN